MSADTGNPRDNHCVLSKQVESELHPTNAQLEKQVSELRAKLEQANVRLHQEIVKCQYAEQKIKDQEEFLQALVDIYPNTILKAGCFGIVTDINALKAVELELQQAKEQLRAVLDAVPGCVSWISSEGRYLGGNRHLADIFNMPPEAFVGKQLGFLDNSSEFVVFIRQFLASSVQTERQVVEVQVNGWSRKYLIAVQKYQQGSIAVSVGIDITERYQAEIEIQESLREKEVLLQEIHHRVKNNLQVIVSMLDLQSQQLETQGMKEAFRESQNRVKSMALVHEILYQSKNFARLNLSDYIQNLTSNLFRAYGVNTSNIKLELDIDEVALNIDTVITCGLIINELVSNAIKYAFPNSMRGLIKIALHVGIDKYLTLIVRDSGVGLPKNLDLKSVNSLGFQLVNVLTKQLGGILEVKCGVGTEFRVYFSEISS
ncbi:MAG: hypothetical protein F6K58_15085 [Symploca sp. SIO2E9]|nr:hypothetical protein [Symploca sp. SIO2E9]